MDIRTQRHAASTSGHRQRLPMLGCRFVFSPPLVAAAASRMAPPPKTMLSSMALRRRVATIVSTRNAGGCPRLAVGCNSSGGGGGMGLVETVGWKTQTEVEEDVQFSDLSSRRVPTEEGPGAAEPGTPQSDEPNPADPRLPSTDVSPAAGGSGGGRLVHALESDQGTFEPPHPAVVRRTTISSRRENQGRSPRPSSDQKGVPVDERSVRFSVSKRAKGETKAGFQPSSASSQPLPPSSVGRRVSSSASSPTVVARDGGGVLSLAQPPNGFSTGQFIHTLYKFGRPHTLKGTAISILSVTMLSLEGFSLTPAVVRAAAVALVSSLLINISIVGLNQLYDVEIDRINKPYLPLVTGELSQQQGWAIVLTSLALSLLLSFFLGSESKILFATVLGSFALGACYSVDAPLLRWKRHPALAAACISVVRSVGVQWGISMHIQGSLPITVAPMDPGSTAPQIARGFSRIFAATMGKIIFPLESRFQGFQIFPRGPSSVRLPPTPVIFLSAFILVFATVIAFFKDIPDIAGDESAGVRTLTSRVGVSRVFWTSIYILVAGYLTAAVFFARRSQGPLGMALAVVLHLIPCALLVGKGYKVDPTVQTEATAFYMLIWELFYAEYALLPLSVYAGRLGI